jgi:hypothetical protein
MPISRIFSTRRTVGLFGHCRQQHLSSFVWHTASATPQEAKPRQVWRCAYLMHASEESSLHVWNTGVYTLLQYVPAYICRMSGSQRVETRTCRTKCNTSEQHLASLAAARGTVTCLHSHVNTKISPFCIWACGYACSSAVRDTLKRRAGQSRKWLCIKLMQSKNGFSD